MDNYFQFPIAGTKQLDLSHARRIFIFGDVHGVLENITNAMQSVAFDAQAGDYAIGVGDWLDRGPDSTKIADFIEENKGWLHFVIGNHEQMLWDAGREGGLNPMNLLGNGGEWIVQHMEDENKNPHMVKLKKSGQRIRDLVCKAPVAMTIKTPAGNIVGCVHAEIPPIDYGYDQWIFDWNDFIDRLNETENGQSTKAACEIAHQAIWGRTVLERVMPKIHYGQSAKEAGMIVRGVDHVFHGHSVMDKITTWGNTSWIDIGAYKRGKIAFVEIDEHIRMTKAS